MTFDDLIKIGEEKIVLDPNFSETERITILAAMKFAYVMSPTLKEMFDKWFQNENGKWRDDPNYDWEAADLPKPKPEERKITIVKNSKDSYTDLINKKINIYPAHADNYMVINNNGTAVRHSFTAVIIHELIHLFTWTRDRIGELLAGQLEDYRQDTVKEANIIYAELASKGFNYNQQNSYIGQDPFGQILTLDYQYTDGAEIDRSFVGWYLDKDNWNSSHGGNLRDLLIGNERDNILISGDGNDFLYGGAGDDHLYGDGNDELSGRNELFQGEGGHDILYGGAGNDHLWGGKGNDTLYGDDKEGKVIGPPARGQRFQ